MLESLSQPLPPLSTQCLNIRGKLLRRDRVGRVWLLLFLIPFFKHTGVPLSQALHNCNGVYTYLSWADGGSDG